MKLLSPCCLLMCALVLALVTPTNAHADGDDYNNDHNNDHSNDYKCTDCSKCTKCLSKQFLPKLNKTRVKVSFKDCYSDPVSWVCCKGGDREGPGSKPYDGGLCELQNCSPDVRDGVRRDKDLCTRVRETELVVPKDAKTVKVQLRHKTFKGNYDCRRGGCCGLVPGPASAGHGGGSSDYGGDAGFFSQCSDAVSGVCETTVQLSSCPTECKSDSDCPSEGPCSRSSCDKEKGVCKQRYLSSSTVCRRAEGPCDVAEYCTGNSAWCPKDKYFPKTTICRERKTGRDGTSCDKTEYCTGDSKDCPSDSYSSAGDVCRAAKGDCDVSERCTGQSPWCPNDEYKKVGTVCRPQQKAADGTTCDKEEKCTGRDSDCPRDDYQSEGTECREKKGECDVAEKCTGKSARCPSNDYESSHKVCRASTGVCDVAEYCTGRDATCPSNSYATSSTVCRPAVKGPDGTTCDKAEYCPGNGKDCPADVYQPAGTTCRAAGKCDVAEVCNGSRVCPPNEKREKGYMFKCGDKLYVCGLKKNELKEARDHDSSSYSYELDFQEDDGHSKRGNGHDDHQETCQTDGIKQVIDLPFPNCLRQCLKACPTTSNTNRNANGDGSETGNGNGNGNVNYFAWAKCQKEKGWGCIDDYEVDRRTELPACPPWGTAN